jgi:hypothetical protein
LDLQQPVQSVPITTKVVSSNPDHGEVFSIQNYVIKFVSDLGQISGFLRVSGVKHHKPNLNQTNIIRNQYISDKSGLFFQKLNRSLSVKRFKYNFLYDFKYFILAPMAAEKKYCALIFVHKQI